MTIIVIIILACAIIVSIVKNNPIDEANKARYQSDRDNMQSIFTNTIAKVMAEKKVTIGVKACELNEVKSGTSSTVGETTYIIDNVESGKIIFDSENNTGTDYYTGKRLPIYSKETIWNVDSEGILTLSVGSKKYSSNESETTNDDGNDSILKGEFRAGVIEFGVIPKSGGSKSVHINFEQPMKDNNYSVTFTCSGGSIAWGETVCKVDNKTNEGFDVLAVNLNPGDSTDNYIANYIVVSYTE